jgi:diguanylate cyclase (GGDEF)-like protein/hemerythrin-like metal-binding protein
VSMETILWDHHFETKIEEVDQQHHRLVDMTNHLSELVITNSYTIDDLNKLLTELIEYTQYHFDEEEKLMQKASIDMRHQSLHKSEHQGFIDQVSLMAGSISLENIESARMLLDFLTHWLVYHILGSDQNFGRQFHSINENGIDPQRAFEEDETTNDRATEMLLNSLNTLFHQLSDRNMELTELNQQLEAKVIDRTKELEKANRKLKILAMTDVLTRLPNRRHAMLKLESLFNNAVENGFSLTCLMIDADGFKQMNDNHGHDAGDIVLHELSGMLRNSIRTDDFASRLGGDEFFIILPGTGLDPGLRIAESIRKNVSEMRVQAGGGIWNGSISIGIASLDPEMKTIDELIKVADESVYLAKKSGKNCVKSLQSQ